MSKDRQSVKTYVPAAQKAAWQTHADELGMSQSEFVRTMVQAGRRGFTMAPPSSDDRSDTPEPRSPGSHPRGDGLETRIERALSGGALSWDALVDTLTGEFEDELESALDSLQEDNRVRYNGRKGGYVRTDE